MNNNLVNTEELYGILKTDDLVVLDASWYLPAQNRSPYIEFLQGHIEKAQFFDIDKISEPDSDYPHMVPNSEQFEVAVRQLGVSNSSRIVIYDGAGLFSAARVWWLFKLFGHENVFVLDGGFPAWQEVGHEITNKIATPKLGDFTARADYSLIADQQMMRNNIDTKQYKVLDARSERRFFGLAPEPRPNLSSGHIPGASSLEFPRLLTNNRMLPEAKLKLIFNQMDVDSNSKIITSCGSGVTAAIITLALDQCGYGMQRLYDGSWTEWASNPDNPIAKNTVS